MWLLVVWPKYSAVVIVCVMVESDMVLSLVWLVLDFGVLVIGVVDACLLGGYYVVWLKAVFTVGVIDVRCDLWKMW